MAVQGLTCGQLCSLLCCPPCPSEIAAKLAFLPPPPTYSISIVNEDAPAESKRNTASGQNASAQAQNGSATTRTSTGTGTGTGAGHSANAPTAQRDRDALLRKQAKGSARPNQRPSLLYSLHLSERAEWQVCCYSS